LNHEEKIPVVIVTDMGHSKLTCEMVDEQHVLYFFGYREKGMISFWVNLFAGIAYVRIPASPTKLSV
jgi:hypothetical protein